MTTILLRLTDNAKAVLTSKNALEIRCVSISLCAISSLPSVYKMYLTIEINTLVPHIKYVARSSIMAVNTMSAISERDTENYRKIYAK